MPILSCNAPILHPFLKRRKRGCEHDTADNDLDHHRTADAENEGEGLFGRRNHSDVLAWPLKIRPNLRESVVQNYGFALRIFAQWSLPSAPEREHLRGYPTRGTSVTRTRKCGGRRMLQ